MSKANQPKPVQPIGIRYHMLLVATTASCAVFGLGFAAANWWKQPRPAYFECELKSGPFALPPALDEHILAISQTSIVVPGEIKQQPEHEQLVKDIETFNKRRHDLMGERVTCSGYTVLKIKNIGDLPAKDIEIEWSPGGMARIKRENEPVVSKAFDKRLPLGDLALDDVISIEFWTMMEPSRFNEPKLIHSGGRQAILAPSSYTYAWFQFVMVLLTGLFLFMQVRSYWTARKMIQSIP